MKRECPGTQFKGCAGVNGRAITVIFEIFPCENIL